jgi:hypothetical protein
MAVLLSLRWRHEPISASFFAVSKMRAGRWSLRNGAVRERFYSQADFAERHKMSVA